MRERRENGGRAQLGSQEGSSGDFFSSLSGTALPSPQDRQTDKIPALWSRSFFFPSDGDALAKVDRET